MAPSSLEGGAGGGCPRGRGDKDDTPTRVAGAPSRGRAILDGGAPTQIAEECGAPDLDDRALPELRRQNRETRLPEHDR